jgi:accessory gene regulator B
MRFAFDNFGWGQTDMIEHLAAGMARFYIRRNIISADEEAVYVYGFELLVSTLCNVSLVVFIGILGGVPAGSVVFMGSFILLRCMGGGYHAKTHRGCIAAFSVLFLAFAFFAGRLPEQFVSLYVLFSAAATGIIVWKVAPVEAANRPLSGNKKARLRNYCLLLVCGYAVLAIIVLIFPAHGSDAVVFFFSGSLAAALSMLLASWRARSWGKTPPPSAG